MSRLVKPMLFASPEECERAFYEAMEHGDVESMGDLWLQDDDVCCTHPGAPRIVGYNAVRSSWASMLASGGVPKTVTVAAIAPENSHDPIVYSAAVMKAGKADAAAKFLNYLQSDKVRAILTARGFGVPQSTTRPA